MAVSVDTRMSQAVKVPIMVLFLLSLGIIATPFVQGICFVQHVGEHGSGVADSVENNDLFKKMTLDLDRRGLGGDGGSGGERPGGVTLGKVYNIVNKESLLDMIHCEFLVI